MLSKLVADIQPQSKHTLYCSAELPSGPSALCLSYLILTQSHNIFTDRTGNWAQKSPFVKYPSHMFSIFYIFKILFMCFWAFTLGLCCCKGRVFFPSRWEAKVPSSSCDERFPVSEGSLVTEHMLSWLYRDYCSCMWNLFQTRDQTYVPYISRSSPTTGPPRKSLNTF